MRYADAITARKVPGPTETKADPFTLVRLIAWLETKLADEVYCYTSVGHCLAAQYNREHGRKYRVVSVVVKQEWATDFDVMLEKLALEEPRTFGAALGRARVLRDSF